MSSIKRVAVVMPAFNEADGIAEFITELATAFNDAGISIVIGLVDDRSSDDTGTVAERAAASAGCPITVAVNDENSGHGPSSVRAWRLGLDLDVDTILHVDGDGQFSGSDVVRVFQAGEGIDGALGVRTTRADPWFRRVVTAALRQYVGLMIGTRIRDANTPLRVYQADRVSELLDALPESPLIPSIYLSAAGVTTGLDLAEVNVESRVRRGDTTVGSTWGESALSFLPTKRLVLFVMSATRESVTTLWGLRKQAGRSS